MQHIYKSSEYILSYFGGLIQIQTDIFYPTFIPGFQHIIHFKFTVDITFFQNMFNIMLFLCDEDVEDQVVQFMLVCYGKSNGDHCRITVNDVDY